MKLSVCVCVNDSDVFAVLCRIAKLHYINSISNLSQGHGLFHIWSPSAIAAPNANTSFSFVQPTTEKNWKEIETLCELQCDVLCCVWSPGVEIVKEIWNICCSQYTHITYHDHPYNFNFLFNIFFLLFLNVFIRWDSILKYNGMYVLGDEAWGTYGYDVVSWVYQRVGRKRKKNEIK